MHGTVAHGREESSSSSSCSGSTKCLCSVKSTAIRGRTRPQGKDQAGGGGATRPGHAARPGRASVRQVQRGGQAPRTCSAGKRCSLSSRAAIGASSFSAKSRQVWRSIWCVSANSTAWYTACSCRPWQRVQAAGGETHGGRWKRAEGRRTNEGLPSPAFCPSPSGQCPPLG